MRSNGPRRTLSAIALAIAVCLIASNSVEASGDEAKGSRPFKSNEAWFANAPGFDQALEEAIAKEQSLVVYFYTDWCGYCRQLERELLTRPEVDDFMNRMTRVRINPESGQTEGTIAQRYGVSGFPSFFVHPGPGHPAKRLSGRVRRDGEWQMQTPDEFIETLTELLASVAAAD